MGTLIYLTEGLVFLTTGLQASTLISRIGLASLSELLVSAVIIGAAVVVTRFIWIYPTTYFPRLLIPSLRQRDPSPPWQLPFVLAFTGVRGIVSLAAALAIPFATSSGQQFPYRDSILFLTFTVILLTLVGQGLLLPFIIRALGLAHAGRRERHHDQAEEQLARRKAIETVIARLRELARERGLSDEVVQPLHARHSARLRHIEHQSGDRDHIRLAKAHDEIERLLIDAERLRINELFRSGNLKDEARRRIERELDLREAQLSNQSFEN